MKRTRFEPKSVSYASRMSCSFDLIAIDLDGTLLDSSGSLPPRNVAAIAAARDAGVEVIVATGRAWIESAHYLRQIDAGDSFIGAGGAILTRSRDGGTIARRPLASDRVERIARAIFEHGHLAHLLKDRAQTGYDYLIVGNGLLDPASEWWFRTMPLEIRRVASLEDDVHPDDTIRCGTVTAAGEAAEVATQIRRDLGDAIFMQHWAAVTEDGSATRRHTHLLEVFTPDTDKWTMVEKYCGMRSIPLDRVAAIGDGLNDIGMVRQAALGIAMGNADPGVLHVASEVVGSNNDHGLADAIELVLSR